MSWHPAAIATASEPDCQPVQQVITPRAHDVGGVSVKRALPTRYCRSVGPFVFLDQMGPATFPPGGGIDVQQHPHIGLGTITYLLEGELLHKDSLGTEQIIQPGAINWMSAGRGIVHSETTRPEVRAAGQTLYGLQTWLALPRELENGPPAFQHVPETELPDYQHPGCRIKLLAGTLGESHSPVSLPTETLYADVHLYAGAALTLPDNVPEMAIYLLSGQLMIAGEAFTDNVLLLLQPGTGCRITADSSTRLVLIGGEPLDAPRHMWWNFVASDRQAIEQAKQDWRAGRFKLADPDAPVLPLPDQSA